MDRDKVILKALEKPNDLSTSEIIDIARKKVDSLNRHKVIVKALEKPNDLSTGEILSFIRGGDFTSFDDRVQIFGKALEKSNFSLDEKIALARTIISSNSFSIDSTLIAIVKTAKSLPAQEIVKIYNKASPFNRHSILLSALEKSKDISVDGIIRLAKKPRFSRKAKDTVHLRVAMYNDSLTANDILKLAKNTKDEIVRSHILKVIADKSLMWKEGNPRDFIKTLEYIKKYGNNPMGADYVLEEILLSPGVKARFLGSNPTSRQKKKFDQFMENIEKFREQYPGFINERRYRPNYDQKIENLIRLNILIDF